MSPIDLALAVPDVVPSFSSSSFISATWAFVAFAARPITFIASAVS